MDTDPETYYDLQGEEYGNVTFDNDGITIEMEFPSDLYKESNKCGLKNIIACADEKDFTKTKYVIVDLFPHPDTVESFYSWFFDNFWWILLIIIISIGIAVFLLLKRRKRRMSKVKKH